jgi:hypothetical protein
MDIDENSAEKVPVLRYSKGKRGFPTSRNIRDDFYMLCGKSPRSLGRNWQ